LSRDISHMAIGIHPVAGTTWLFHGGSVKFGSVTVTSWFISLHTVLAPLMIIGSLSLSCDLNWAGLCLYELDGRLLLISDRDDMWVSVLTHQYADPVSLVIGQRSHTLRALCLHLQCVCAL